MQTTFSLDKNVFSLDKVREILSSNQKPREERSGPPIAFLPSGKHSIRWFFDPTGELYRECRIGRVGRTRFLIGDNAADTNVWRTASCTKPIILVNTGKREKRTLFWVIAK